MGRGGSRVGAGRKAQGITRKVSLTLTGDEWARIDAAGGTVAAFLRELMQGQRGFLDPDMQSFWKERLSESEQRCSDLLRQLEVMEQKFEKGNSNQGIERLTPRQVDELWEICTRNETGQHTPEALVEAKESLFGVLFPSGGDQTEIATQPQYICPFTNKRFSSPNKLIRAAIPRLIESKERYLKDRKAAKERQQAKEEAARHWQQLIDEGKLPGSRSKS